MQALGWRRIRRPPRGISALLSWALSFADSAHHAGFRGIPRVPAAPDVGGITRPVRPVLFSFLSKPAPTSSPWYMHTIFDDAHLHACCRRRLSGGFAAGFHQDNTPAAHGKARMESACILLKHSNSCWSCWRWSSPCIGWHRAVGSQAQPWRQGLGRDDRRPRRHARPPRLGEFCGANLLPPHALFFRTLRCRGVRQSALRPAACPDS